MSSCSVRGFVLWLLVLLVPLPLLPFPLTVLGSLTVPWPFRASRPALPRKKDGKRPVRVSARRPCGWPWLIHGVSEQDDERGRGTPNQQDDWFHRVLAAKFCVLSADQCGYHDHAPHREFKLANSCHALTFDSSRITTSRRAKHVSYSVMSAAHGSFCSSDTSIRARSRADSRRHMSSSMFIKHLLSFVSTCCPERVATHHAVAMFAHRPCRRILA